MNLDPAIRSRSKVTHSRTHTRTPTKHVARQSVKSVKSFHSLLSARCLRTALHCALFVCSLFTVHCSLFVGWFVGSLFTVRFRSFVRLFVRLAIGRSVFGQCSFGVCFVLVVVRSRIVEVLSFPLYLHVCRFPTRHLLRGRGPRQEAAAEIGQRRW